MKNIKIFEAFAGIGSQFKALKNIARQRQWNIIHSGMIEWYVDAIIAYVAIHAPEFKPKIENLNAIKNISYDSKSLASQNAINKLNNSLKASYLNYSKNQFNNLFDIKSAKAYDIEKNIDIFTYSFPCQDLSVQGLQKGMNQKDNTRSGLLWEIGRILFEIKKQFKKEEMPKYLLMENVKNILGKNNKQNFLKWINTLNKLGYLSKTYVLNSKHFGSCQSRDRVFCLSIRKDYYQKINFKFPDLEKIRIQSKPIKDILINSNDNIYI